MKTTTITILSFLSTATAAPLAKRADEYLSPKPVIVLLIMLGAGLLVCMGFAVHSTFGFKRDGNDVKEMSPEQMEYMTQVRVRNMGRLMAEGARSHGHGKRRDNMVYD
jgi:hypothetical protein